MNLILMETPELTASGEATLADGRATHLLEVLKVTPGQEIRVGLLDGPLGRGTVTTVAESAVRLRCVFDATAPERPRIDLLLAVPRPKVMRRLWAQLSALGVGQIILTNADRVERDYFDTHILTPETYRPLLIEGLQQARDTRMPLVSIHRRFKVLVEDDLDALFSRGTRIVADPSATTQIRTALETTRPERVLLAVGPEGGWNEFELGLLQAHSFHAVGVGARTLRVDTACVALLGIVSDALGGPEGPPLRT